MAKKPNILSEDFIEYLIIRLKEVFPTKEDIQEQLKGLPTKEEFYTENDKVMKELKDLRDEVSATTHRSSDNTKRIEKLETRVFKN